MMLHEAIGAALSPQIQGLYVDAAFGRGVYSAELLRQIPPSCRLLVVCDPSDRASAAAAQELARKEQRIEAVIVCQLGEVAERLAGRQLAGVVVDLGIAFQQHGDDAFKGMSPVDDVPLDLRADPSRGQSASEWIRGATVAELAWVIHAYGEDDDPCAALRIAEAAMHWQERHGPYRTVFQLVDVIRKVKSATDERGLHPAKLTLQALRVFVNGELDQLDTFLNGIMPLLVPGARLAVVTVRRVEASCVKSFMRHHEDAHPLLATGSTTERLVELYPLMQTTEPWAVLQATEPLWPSADGGGRRPRSLATHVLQRVVRKSPPGSGGCHRNDAELFAQPAHLPFVGGAPSAAPTF